MEKSKIVCPECKKEGTIISSSKDDHHLLICLINNCSFKKVFHTEEEMSDFYHNEIEQD